MLELLVVLSVSGTGTVLEDKVAVGVGWLPQFLVFQDQAALGVLNTVSDGFAKSVWLDRQLHIKQHTCSVRPHTVLSLCTSLGQIWG